MQHDEQPSTTDDEFALRLAWPEPHGGAADEGAQRSPERPASGVGPASSADAEEPGAEELGPLRQAVDDLGERLHLRHLRASIDELRVDVTGLRRAVLDRPELEQVLSDVAGLRADVSASTESADASLAAALAPLVDELALLRTELTALRRRVGLRAEGTGDGLDESQLERVAEAVADRVAAQLRAADGRTGRRR